MRLRAQFTIDIDVGDFAEAAKHQERLEQFYEMLHEEYDQAQWEFRQRRERNSRQPVYAGMRHYTGRMGEYDE